MLSMQLIIWIVIGMKWLLAVIALLFLVQDVSAETASDGNITISIDIPEYVSQNETFIINLSAVDISVYDYASGRVYLDSVLLKRSDIFFDFNNIWNTTIEWIINGGVGGLDWYLPSDTQYNVGQTIPLKFRAQKVTHIIKFKVIYWPIGYGMNLKSIIVDDDITAFPVFDPSVNVTVSNASAIVFEAVSGKGVDYIRFSEGNQQYIVNWDSSGNPAGEYNVRAGFNNGYVSETKIVLQ